MEELLAGFITGLPEGAVLSSMELLYLLGRQLGAKGVNSILAAAARAGAPHGEKPWPENSD